MTEIEKAEETILYMDMFHLIRKRVALVATSSEQFNKMLEVEIDKWKRECQNIINPPAPKVLLKPRKK